MQMQVRSVDLGDVVRVVLHWPEEPTHTVLVLDDVELSDLIDALAAVRDRRVER